MNKDTIRIAEERFWPKVDKSGECWEWLGSNSGGYGQFYFQGRMMRATHFSLLCEGSDVPSGMLVCHSCDNPPCVNPCHLFIGTVADNNRDRDAKGRGYKHPREKYQSMQKIMSRKLRRFTPDEVRAMRSSDLSGAQLARDYGVTPQTMNWILRRKIYADVE